MAPLALGYHFIHEFYFAQSHNKLMGQLAWPTLLRQSDEVPRLCPAHIAFPGLSKCPRQTELNEIFFVHFLRSPVFPSFFLIIYFFLSQSISTVTLPIIMAT